MAAAEFALAAGPRKLFLIAREHVAERDLGKRSSHLARHDKNRAVHMKRMLRV